ncbi:hypothetical protein C725_2824 [Pacificimonas flava]|uniref:Uncharacterized protein n=1 Tax=Pacificimonas flava TaxID=1234595 RepID=M2U1J7_9SPHN|nr:hypothetical protein C725_2824 [Pacificimonas flava]
MRNGSRKLSSEADPGIDAVAIVTPNRGSSGPMGYRDTIG